MAPVDETPGRNDTFHSAPFRQSKPGVRAGPRKALESKDSVDFSSAPQLPLPVVPPAAVAAAAAASPPRRIASEAAKQETAASARPAALSGAWVKSEHEGLLTLHDGAKRWYHCELCEYRNDRLYHSKMHFLRIHVNNGKSMPRKRKYADGPAGPVPSAPPNAAAGRKAGGEAVGLGSRVTPAKATKRAAVTPPRTDHAGKSPKKEGGKPRQRLSFGCQPQGLDGGKARHVGNHLKVFELHRSDADSSDAPSWSVDSAARIMTFRDASIGCEDGGGPGVSINVGEMSSPANLPVGRTTIGAQGTKGKKLPKARQRGPSVKDEEAEGTWVHADHPFEHDEMENNTLSANSCTRVESSLSKGMMTPSGTPGCSPNRPTSLRGIGGMVHTPMAEPHERLRSLGRMSASPDKFRSPHRSADNMLLGAPASNALGFGRSPGPIRRTRGGSSDPVGHALMCHETMEGMQGCELGGLADLTDWGNSQVLSVVPFRPLSLPISLRFQTPHHPGQSQSDALLMSRDLMPCSCDLVLRALCGLGYDLGRWHVH